MEGNQEQLKPTGFDESYLSLWSVLSDDDGRDLSILYPELPRDYFKDKEGALTTIRWTPKVAPYVRRRDLATGGDDGSDSAKPKIAWEIGISGGF